MGKVLEEMLDIVDVHSSPIVLRGQEKTADQDKNVD